MSKKTTSEQQSLCPSAQPDMTNSVLFGVKGGDDEPLISYLNKPKPVTQELLDLVHPVEPTEIFRFAAPCATRGCQHFDGTDCQLAKRTVENLPEAVDILPPCSIRSTCRWWSQEGKAACLRCPKVVTHVIAPSDIIVKVARPSKDTA